MEQGACKAYADRAKNPRQDVRDKPHCHSARKPAAQAQYKSGSEKGACKNGGKRYPYQGYHHRSPESQKHKCGKRYYICKSNLHPRDRHGNKTFKAVKGYGICRENGNAVFIL